jgi:serine acetyltransferase
MCHRVYSALAKVKMGLDLHLTAQVCSGLGLGHTPVLDVAHKDIWKL